MVDPGGVPKAGPSRGSGFRCSVLASEGGALNTPGRGLPVPLWSLERGLDRTGDGVGLPTAVVPGPSCICAKDKRGDASSSAG